MIEQDFDEFSRLLNTLSEYFRKPMSPGVIGIYWQGLRDLELTELRAALNAHVQNPDVGQFMPTIADIRRMVGGSTKGSALDAWSKVEKAMNAAGPYADVVFDDPIIHRVIHDMGGWIAFGAKKSDEWPFVGNEFQTRYRDFKMRGEIPAYEPVLIGIAGAHNRNGGFPVEPPRFIGDPNLCERVRVGGTDRPLLSIAPAAAHAPRIERRIQIAGGL